MHHSRISTLLIDVPAGQAASSATFWSAALGVEAREVPGEEEFTSLPNAVPGLVTAVQSLGEGTARYHLDIETDDVEAEGRRLVALGARELSRWDEGRRLEVPGGQLVCVIPVHSDRDTFLDNAQVWP